jgi:DNA-directed RNA polymerase subunit omega
LNFVNVFGILHHCRFPDIKRRAASLKDFGNVDSKYRFVIIAAKRAKELLRGSKPRLKSKSRNPIRIAQSEVKLGLVDFEVIPSVKEEAPEVEERVFLGEEVGGVFEEDHEEGAAPATKTGRPAAADEDEELGVDFTEEFEPLGAAAAAAEEKEEDEEEEAGEDGEEVEDQEEGGENEEEG